MTSWGLGRPSCTAAEGLPPAWRGGAECGPWREFFQLAKPRAPGPRPGWRRRLVWAFLGWDLGGTGRTRPSYWGAGPARGRGAAGRP